MEKLVFSQYVNMAKVKRVTKLLHRRYNRMSKLSVVFTEMAYAKMDKSIPKDNVNFGDVFLMEIYKNEC